MKNEVKCSKCNRIFYGEDRWKVDFELGEHIKYCKLTTHLKVLRVLLSPLAFVGLLIMIIGGVLLYSISPLGYPFVYAVSLCFDNESVSYGKYNKNIGLDTPVHTRKGKFEQ